MSSYKVFIRYSVGRPALKATISGKRIDCSGIETPRVFLRLLSLNWYRYLMPPTKQKRMNPRKIQQQQ
jgi:hypothetical protein